MIQQSESSLGAADYAKLLAATEDPSDSVVLSQYTLALSSHDSSGLGAASDCFDAIVCGDVLVRAYYSAANTLDIDTLASEDGGNQAWANQNLAATNIVESVPISLAVSGNTVRVFWYDGSDIKYFESLDDGANWGAIQTVATVARVVFLGATALTRVHYLTRTDSRNQLFSVAEFTVAWATTDSDLYWPFEPSSFDAIAGNQVDDGAAASNDLLMFTTDYPPIIGQKIVSTELTQTLNRVQGIATVRYQNGRWGGHHEYDVIDEAASYPARYGLRLSHYGTLLFATYYRVDGTEDYSHTGIALSRSKDGIDWEFNYLLDDVIGTCSILLKRGDHAYLLNAWKTYRSYSVGYTGDSKITQDVTANVLNLSTKMGDIQQLDLTLGNPYAELDVTTPFSNDACIQAKVELGYVVDGSDLRVQTFLGDIDSVGTRQQIPTNHVTITARDYLARMMSFNSDQAIEWDSQQIGGDEFETHDDTDYSGLRHTAAQDGSWKTPSGTNTLLLVSDQAPGVAFNTFVRDAWNGSCQAGFRVAKTNSDDYAGLLFRAYDKRNMYNVKYDAENDVIKLYDRKDDLDELLYTSGAMGWSVDVWYYLKVRFWYQKVYVYSSTDGVTWTEEMAVELTGVDDTVVWTWENFVARVIPNLTGRMGYIAHGWSDEDDYYPPPPPSLPPTPDAPPVTEDSDLWIFGTNGAGVFYTLNWGDANPNYHDMSKGLSTGAMKTISNLKIMQWADGHNSLFACNGCGIFEYCDLPSTDTHPTGMWYEHQTSSALALLAGVSGNNAYVSSTIISIEHEGWMWAWWSSWEPDGMGGYRNAWWGVAYTQDGWKTMSHSVVVSSWSHGHYAEAYAGNVVVAQHSGGQTLYACGSISAGGSGAQKSLYKSTNSGATWTLLSSAAVYGASLVYCPYHSAGWNDSYVYYGDGADLLRSVDSGASFQTIVSGSGTFRNLGGPTYDKNILSIPASLHEWWNGDASLTTFLKPVDQTLLGSFVKKRKPNKNVEEWIFCHGKLGGFAQWINLREYRSDGTDLNKTGDWAAVTGNALTRANVISRREYESKQVY